MLLLRLLYWWLSLLPRHNLLVCRMVASCCCCCLLPLAFVPFHQGSKGCDGTVAVVAGFLLHLLQLRAGLAALAKAHAACYSSSRCVRTRAARTAGQSHARGLLDVRWSSRVLLGCHGAVLSW